MELLKNIRAYEDVFFEDPEENPDTPRFRVWFDDKHIEEYLAKVGNAIDRAQANEQMAREADTPEKAAEANAAQARLMKRTISALVVGLALVGQHLDDADDRERVVAHQHLLAVPRVARGARAVGQPHPLGRERGWQHYLPPFFLRLALARRWARLSAWT